MQDEEFKLLLRKWPAEEVPPGLLDRVVRKAVAAPQQRSWREQLLWIGEQVFGRWPNGLAYRCAALLICVFAGIHAGGSIQISKHPAMPDGQELALADDIIGFDNQIGEP